MRNIKLLSLLLSCLLTPSAFAQVSISHPWVRATVPNQHATGAFLTLHAQHTTQLVSASSPVAKTVELHEMTMEGEVMKMRAVPSLDIPQNKAVELKPGGYHIMLIDLKSQLKEDDIVPLTLTFRHPDGRQETSTVEATVKPLATTAPTSSNPASGHTH